MTTITVKAIQPHSYKGVRRKVGDVYQVQQNVAGGLVRSGLVVIEEEPEKGTYQRRDMRAKDK